MNQKINIYQFIENQKKERYKNFIIFGPAMSGKTGIAKKLAGKLHAVYVDLLEEFVSNVSIKTNIDTFEPRNLKEYVQIKSGMDSFIIIDNMDFLLNTWDASQKESFFKFVELDEYKNIYCFVIQESKSLKKATFTNSLGQKRVLSLYEIK